MTAVDFTEDLLSRLFKSVSKLGEVWELVEISIEFY